MIPIYVHTTTYTVKSRGRVLKFVRCESCATEFVYALEREASGAGTTYYGMDHEGAAGEAEASSQETLTAVLEHDYDPVPCPACGHYQRYMFPKLMAMKGMGGAGIRLVVLLAACLDGIGALYWTILYVERPNDYAFTRMLALWSVLAVLASVGMSLSLLTRYRIRRFNPNVGDKQARIALGRSRAVTREEYEKGQQPGRGTETVA
jgi:hypothetical protein